MERGSSHRHNPFSKSTSTAQCLDSRTVRYTPHQPEPSSSHWLSAGTFTSFSDFRFAIRARLNLLPTKTVVKRAGHPEIDTTCPKYHQGPETLGHVLNACMLNACTPNAGLMRERHNTILQRLVKAVPREAGDKFIEQKIRDSTGDLRPDLVILNSKRKTATIVDVTIPYEGEVTSFEAARAEKLRKYHPVVELKFQRSK